MPLFQSSTWPVASVANAGVSLSATPSTVRVRSIIGIIASPTYRSAIDVPAAKPTRRRTFGRILVRAAEETAGWWVRTRKKFRWAGARNADNRPIRELSALACGLFLQNGEERSDGTGQPGHRRDSDPEPRPGAVHEP